MISLQRTEKGLILTLLLQALHHCNSTNNSIKFLQHKQESRAICMSFIKYYFLSCSETGIGQDCSFLDRQHMGPHQEWCHVEPLWGDAFSSGIGRPHKKLSGCGIVRTGSLPLKEKGRVVEQMSISSPPPRQLLFAGSDAHFASQGLGTSIMKFLKFSWPLSWPHRNAVILPKCPSSKPSTWHAVLLTFSV